MYYLKICELKFSFFLSTFIYLQKNAVRVIFSADNSSFYVGEELVGLRQWNRNPFQHFITSTHHLTLCDERYPKIPVCLFELRIIINFIHLHFNIFIIEHSIEWNNNFKIRKYLEKYYKIYSPSFNNFKIYYNLYCPLFSVIICV